MEIQLPSCSVRSWRWEDRDDLVRHANNRKVWINLRDHFPHPYTQADARDYLKAVIGHWPETSYAIAVHDQVVGGIGFTLQTDVGRRSAEIGYWLGEEVWGRGIASQALIAVTEFAFNTHDICRLFAHVFEWNPASARVLEKAGYTLEGCLRKSVIKDGHVIDRLIYAMIRE